MIAEKFIRSLLLFFILLSLAGINQVHARPIHFVLVGDSTVAPNGGWGPAFMKFITDDVTCTNVARAGRSSKSFVAEGHWATALALHGDYYLIQFGHNDQPGKGPDRETDPATTYPANLVRFVDEVRAQGGVPVLITSLPRRNFSLTNPGRIESSLTPYAEAVTKVATEKRVRLIDLHRLSIDFCEKLGPTGTSQFNRIKPDGSPDTTHLSPVGGDAFARILVAELQLAEPDLRKYFRDLPQVRDTGERGIGTEDGTVEPAPTVQ